MTDDVGAMVERLRNEYRGRFFIDRNLVVDPVLYDEAHSLYDSLQPNTEAEARLWAVIWVYELLVSPHSITYMRWPVEDGDEIGEFLGDFETRRIHLDPSGDADLWTDMADVRWSDGRDMQLTDQPMDFAAALAGGARFVERAEFDAGWAAATTHRMAGTPNPALAASIVATFEELRIARNSSAERAS